MTRLAATVPSAPQTHGNGHAGTGRSRIGRGHRAERTDLAHHAGRAAHPVRGADTGKTRAARVRSYAITGGRTRSGYALQVETFIATVDGPLGHPDEYMGPEEHTIVELCRRVRSVAEISALLRIPLGIVRVLLSDLADQGRIRVFGTGHGPGAPGRALLERVLSGLHRL
jgi:hypothetical protein